MGGCLRGSPTCDRLISTLRKNNNHKIRRKKSDLNPDSSKTIKEKNGETKHNQGEGKHTKMEKRPWPETRHATVMETTDATMAGDETVFGDPTMCFIVDANEGDVRCYHGQRW